jgi:RNA polymerase sigma-70 factor, ECF subfamily
MDWTDAAAAKEASKGNQHAFRVLVERHSRAIFKLAFRMTGNEYDAEDIVQETFLRAYKQIQRFDGRAAFSTWLYRIAANCSIDLMRARKIERRVEPSDPARPFDWMEHVATNAPTPERLSESGQIATHVNAALKELSEMERAAFVLRHYEGQNVEQIALALGVRQNAAKHSIFRAVQKLRRALAPLSEVTE